MARTFIRQDAQVSSTNQSDVGFVDNVAPAATMESGAVSLADDLNNIRSMLSYFNDLQTGNWYDAFTAPPVFPSEGAVRGVQTIADDLHALERKRVLVTVTNLSDVAVPATQNYVVLSLAQLPSNTTAAVGAVTTRGTVAAAHGGSFGTSHSLTEVSGSTAISPKNLCEVVDGASRDPIVSSGRTVYALFQTETATDGHTMTGTTPNRAQLSFVRINAAGDDLEACPVSDIEGRTVNYASVERKALEDLNEQDFLRGAIVDTPSGSTVTRQVAYDNQGTTPVELTTNADLDLNSAGIAWRIRDLTNALLFRVLEGSGGGTSQIQFGTDVDMFNNDAVVNDFAAGATIRSGGTRPIAVGVTDGVLATTAGDLEVRGFAELYLDDGNQAGSTWAQTAGIKLSDTTAEWDRFETAFGEVSLLRAIAQARRRPKVYAAVTANTAADTDVGGVGGGANLSAQLPDMSIGDFLTDYDVFLNGQLLRPGANAAANNDYYPGTSLANGQLRFEFALKGTGATPDVICVVPYARYT